MHPEQLLARIDAYCDEAPRATADAERVGPFTLFVARTGWPFYARPATDRDTCVDFDRASMDKVLARQRALGIPLTFEWVHQTAPDLLAATTAYGLATQERPLLVRTSRPPTPPVDGVRVEMIDPDDERVVAARAAVSAGFAETDELRPEPMADTIRARAREGLLSVAGAFGPHGTAIGGGTFARRDRTCELTGISVLPSARGRGVGAALTTMLAERAVADGADLVWLSATDDTVARVYERVGFTRVGTTCEAEAPSTR